MKSKSKPKNLLKSPTLLLSMVLLGLAAFNPVKDEYLETGKVPTPLIIEAFWDLTKASIALALARYNEDSGNLYTPGLLPGNNREDLYKEETHIVEYDNDEDLYT